MVVCDRSYYTVFVTSLKKGHFSGDLRPHEVDVTSLQSAHKQPWRTSKLE